MRCLYEEKENLNLSQHSEIIEGELKALESYLVTMTWRLLHGDAVAVTLFW